MTDGLGHRERLLQGLARSIKEKGFTATTVADIVRNARTSRRTFYEHFADREACFVALMHTLVDASIAAIEAAIDPDAPWEEQVAMAVDANLRMAALEPELIRSSFREMGMLGERGAAIQRAEADRFADLLLRLVAEARARGVEVQPIEQDAAVLVVAGIRELVVRAVESERDIMDLRPVATQTIRALLAPR